MKSIPVVYENDEILIINKPAGLPVQGGKGIVHSLDTELPLQLGYKIYLVHRLDKDTDGLMIAAKTPAAASKWTKLIAGKAVRKEYTAVCAGTLKPENGTIASEVVQHGICKQAVTHYHVEFQKEVECGGETVHLSFIHLQLETGRMHQIRIHLAENGCPIAGDDLHGNFRINKLLRKNCGVKRMLLTAVKLTVPIDGKSMVFEIPLTDMPQSGV